MSWMHEEDDKPLEDYEYPDEFDDGDDYTRPCPHCGAEIYDDADYCPVCNQYILSTTSPWHGRSATWLILGLVGAIAAVMMLLLAAF